MRRLLIAVALFAAVGAAAYLIGSRGNLSAGAAPELAGAPATAAVLARGEYLAKAAGCIACHTVPGSEKPFAGGVGFSLAFGTLYSTNITADGETGIGSWSDDEFVRALHDGVRKDGRHLYPVFPYTSYTKLSRSDVLAIKTYLFSLPAIRQANRPNDLRFPFDQRWAVGFWKAAFFRNQRFVADSSKSSQWNSGAYLATALGHCGECHTPRNFAFGLEHSREFAGEEILGWRAYNITPDPEHGIGSWSDDDIARYLTLGHADGRGSASGPMGEAVANSLQYLNPSDTAALVAYLRDMPARKGDHPTDIDARPAPAMASTGLGPGPEAAGANSQGRQLFEGACASCHLWNGAGLESRYAALLGTRAVNDLSGVNVTEAILYGADFKIGDREVFMPPFGAGYSNSEVAALTNYVIAHFGNKHSRVTPDDVARLTRNTQTGSYRNSR
ncbi:MAG: c-type cytochrome [Steroidobacteraceae bacterium]